MISKTDLNKIDKAFEYLVNLNNKEIKGIRKTLKDNKFIIIMNYEDEIIFSDRFLPSEPTTIQIDLSDCKNKKEILIQFNNLKTKMIESK